MYRGGYFSGTDFTIESGEGSASRDKSWAKSGLRAGRQVISADSTMNLLSAAGGSSPVSAHNPLWLQPASPRSASALWPTTPSAQQAFFSQQSITAVFPVQPENLTAAPATDTPVTITSSNKNRLKFRRRLNIIEPSAIWCINHVHLYHIVVGFIKINLPGKTLTGDFCPES